MSGYTHPSALERDRIAELRAAGAGVRAIARALGRAASTVSRELSRNALPSGAYRPVHAEGCYRFRRQRPAILETDTGLQAFVVDRLAEGWTPEQIAGWLRRGIERGLRAISFETIYAFIFRASQRAERLWRYLVRGKASRGRRRARRTRDRIRDKVQVSQRSDAAATRQEAGHWEGDLIICRRARPVLVLHERKTRLTLMTRLAGKTAGETVAAIMAVVRRLEAGMRGSITFDNDTCFAHHALLRGMFAATTYFCDAYASWQKGGAENANGRIRRWLPRRADLDALEEDDIQEIAMTLNLAPRKCLGFRSPLEAFLGELGKSVQMRFHRPVALRG